MDQTLTSFRDLLRPDHSLSVGEQQQRVAEALPELVAQSHLSWLAQPESPNGTGDKLVVGVAVWSGHDLTLLDELNQFAESHPTVRVHVFDVDKIGGEFERIVPGVGEVFHTPVVGRWVNGTLKEKGSGHVGRQIVRRVIASAPTAAT